MKKLILLITVLLLFAAQGFTQKLLSVVVYDSYEARSSCAAAVLKAKFSTAMVDVSGKLAAVYGAEIAALADSTFHKVFVVCDTTNTDIAGNLQGTYKDTLALKLSPTLLNDELPDDDIIIIVQTATASWPEIIWDRSDVYSGITAPLIVSYLSYGGFSEVRFAATTASDSSANLTGATWTNDVFVGNNLFVTADTGLGQTSPVIDNLDDTMIVFSPKFSTAIGIGSQVVVRDEGRDFEDWYDIYCEIYIEGNMADVLVNWNSWHKLIDANSKLNKPGRQRAYQDINFLNNTVIPKGKAVFDYLKR